MMFEFINDIVHKEFGTIANKFETVVFFAGKPPQIENPHRGGVYIFFMGDQIWKIGKHNVNAYKRCLQHFQDDTGSNKGKGMKQYENDTNMAIVLFLLRDGKKDLHWTYALECFLETHFRDNGNLVIPSARL